MILTKPVLLLMAFVSAWNVADSRLYKLNRDIRALGVHHGHHSPRHLRSAQEGKSERVKRAEEGKGKDKELSATEKVREQQIEAFGKAMTTGAQNMHKIHGYWTANHAMNVAHQIMDATPRLVPIGVSLPYHQGLGFGQTGLPQVVPNYQIMLRKKRKARRASHPSPSMHRY